MKLRIREQSMKTALQALRVSLCVLALGTGVAAQAAAPVITNITMVGATPQFAVQSDLGVTNQIQYSTDLSQTNWVVLTNLMVVQSPVARGPRKYRLPLTVAHQIRAHVKPR